MRIQAEVLRKPFSMLYDKNPLYPHYSHLPYSREPWKTLYVLQRLLTTLFLVPIWIIKFALLSRQSRPRSSWNLRQVVYVNFTRRIFKVTEVAGVTWGTRDPARAPDEGSLKETEFTWVEPLKPKWRTGILSSGSADEDGDERVSFARVGCYVWPKPKETERNINRDLENGAEAEDGDGDGVELIGLFMHGGGYCHMSAHENSGTSRIPRGLIQRKILDKVYAVEYRLLQHAPFPAVIMDAAAVYAHVVERYASRVANDTCKIILVGDSSGGNLVLGLARWIRDEGHFLMPTGLLLLSPTSDPSHHLPETLSSYIPRPNKESDYLVDTIEPRALLQRTFLGFKHRHHHHHTRHKKSTAVKVDNDHEPLVEETKRLMETVHSEYVSPCSPIVLQRWGHEAKQDPEGVAKREFLTRMLTGACQEEVEGCGWNGLSSLWMSKEASRKKKIEQNNSQVEIEIEPPSRDDEAATMDAILPADVERALKSTLLYPSRTSASLLTPTTSASASTLPSRIGSPTPPGCCSSSASMISCTPTPRCTFPTLFSHFPPTHVTIGTAERLTREVSSLICALEKDGVDVSVNWAKDACHDVLMVPPWWWDQQVVGRVWEGVGEWAKMFRV